MPEENPDVTAAVAAERARCTFLCSVLNANHQEHGLAAKVFTALSHGYEPEECEQRWGEKFKVQP